MMFHRRQFLHLAGATVVGLAVTDSSRAQAAYPARPVRVIVPFTPGGPTDLFARLIAAKLAEQLGQQFYIENVGGAGGNIGAGRAAQAAPDGYTIFVNGGNHVINPSLFHEVPYDPIKSFDPVTIAVTSPALLAVNPDVPAKTVKELVDEIRANPKKYSFSTPATGTPPDLVGELFRLALKLDVVRVPFKGGGESLTSVVGGQIPITFGTIAPAIPLVKAGKLRALAVTGKARMAALPDVPTFVEAGFPQIAGETWFCVVAPKGTPQEFITKLHDAVAKALALPDVQQRLEVLGYVPLMSSAEEATARFKSDGETWAKVIKDSGMKPD